MKIFNKTIALLVFFTGFLFFTSSCSKDEKTPDPVYTCLTCKTTPEALAVNDVSVKGIYKGIVVGSTGTIAINIQNGSNTITATMVLDGVSVALTSNVSIVDGQSYVAPFTGTFNGSPITMTFSVGLGGSTPVIVSSSIPGHPNAVFNLYKETSTSLIEAFEGTYSKTGESGTFNILLSKGIGKWGGIVKKGTDSVTGEIKGTYSTSNQIIDENGTVVGVVAGDVLHGSFLDGNNNTVTTNGHRTL
ncbi:hypothetical protein [Flavobacterium psychrotolerans]|uniref:Lipoprotein n=1 Tax=Flavobacterium psychrotolerans TaxID=2169410 RepID=A0A2U1JQK4_9FLAO|nr:hypothetical protein [Flavobacterium psychrotolerans]PWA07441.1 hypothetical protein DB895_01615 [Flavobacterium psychrotolerans]